MQIKKEVLDMYSPDWSLQLGLVGRVGGAQEGEGG